MPSAVPEDVRVRALAAGRADGAAVSLVPGSFEVGYVAEDGSAHRVAVCEQAADAAVWATAEEMSRPILRKPDPSFRCQPDLAVLPRG